MCEVSRIEVTVPETGDTVVFQEVDDEGVVRIWVNKKE
jgi:hypothetical protein